MDLHHINLNLLAALDALLAERHVGRAARRTGVTQSAMSHSLRQLRELLGDPILVRAGQHMVPTPRAEAIAPLLQDGMRSLERVLEAPAEADPATFTHAFTLALPDLLTAGPAAGVLRRMRREAPMASLAIVSPGPDLEEAMRRGRVHASIMPPFALAAGLQRRVLHGEGWRVIGRADHPALQGELDLDAYCALPHVMQSWSGTGGSFIDEALAPLGRSRRIALRLPYGLAIPDALVATDLIATVPKGVAGLFSERQSLRAVPTPAGLPMPPTDMMLVWHERYDADPAHRWLRRVLVESLAEIDSAYRDSV